MNNITTIIPVADITQEELPILETALNSIKNQKDKLFPPKVIIVHKEADASVLSLISKTILSDLDITFVVNTGSATIQNQINKAVESVTTPYFAYLEFDDQFTNFYFKYVDEYVNTFKDVSVLLPLIADIISNGTFIRYGNAECYSRDISESPGFVTHDALTKVPMFNSLSGGVFKTEDFVDLGKLKENIKYTFIYEYLLRITNQDQKVMVIPKIGYVHILDRIGSYTTTLNKSNVTAEEMAFWYETAKKQFYFKKFDKKIEYEPKTV
jgi:hypothetical protein